MSGAVRLSPRTPSRRVQGQTIECGVVYVGRWRQRFEGICCLHLQGNKASLVRLTRR
jgi:hypothetical protein